MEFVNDAFNRTLVFYLLETAIFVFFVLLGIFYVCNHGRKSDAIGLITIAVIVFGLFIIVFDVAPFVTDYINHDIVVVSGIYQNNNQSSSHSSDLGIHGVTIETDHEVLHLTTVPFCDEVFVLGTYDVVAYYAPRSEMLLFIELLSEVPDT